MAVVAPDTVVVGCWDGTVHLFNYREKVTVSQTSWHDASINRVSYHACRVIAGSTDGRVSVHRVN
jgi:hypothetical protein